MKKTFSVIFILLAFIFTIGVLSGYTKTKTLAEEKHELAECSKSAYLIDFHSGSVIYKKNEDERRPIASMCKIMTLLLCFESLDNEVFKLDDEIIVSENASGMGGSQVFLESNAKYPARELIKSIVVASANDASVAMAEFISGSESEFVCLMNERANQLGMTNTNFTNCTGIPKPGQYSSAKDVASMFSELLKHEEYYKFSRIWMDKVIHPNDRWTGISNTNRLIRFYDGCDSGKTGYTSEAGHCIAVSATRGDMRLVSVIICAPDSKTRFNEASEMLNYGFANYANKLIIDKNEPLDIAVKVDNGKKDNISVSAENSFYLFSKKNEKRSVEINFIPLEEVKAPVVKGEEIGELSVCENGKEIARIKVISNEDVACKTYFDILHDVAKNWSLI